MFFDHLKIKSFVARSETSADVNDSSEFRTCRSEIAGGLEAGGRQAGGRSLKDLLLFDV